VIRLSENSVTLGRLVSMCYPVADDVDFGNISVYEVLKAAMKYEMKKIIQILSAKLADYIERDPLRMYFTSIALGLEEEAIKASKAFVLSFDDSANAYVREMELVPAIAYHRLLKYRHQCRAAAYNPQRSLFRGMLLVSMGIVALPVIEREWSMQGNRERDRYPPLPASESQMSSALTEENKLERMLSKILAGRRYICEYTTFYHPSFNQNSDTRF
jgi:hypothetical protein